MVSSQFAKSIRELENHLKRLEWSQHFDNELIPLMNVEVKYESSCNGLAQQYWIVFENLPLNTTIPMQVRQICRRGAPQAHVHQWYLAPSTKYLAIPLRKQGLACKVSSSTHA